MHILCLDLEGVLVPEVWVNFAAATGIEGFRLTTKDMPDYDALMRHRLDLLDRHGMRLPDIEATIASSDPLPGARDFVDWVRSRWQLVILSDTYYEFARPLMQKLGWPTLLCHRLKLDREGRILGYRLRQKDPKRHAVRAFQAMNFKVAAAGDSYNDVNMLEEANTGTFFRPNARIVADFPQYPVARDYQELRTFLNAAEAELSASGEQGSLSGEQA